MKIKAYVVDFEIRPRAKRWALRIGIPAAVIAVGAVALASTTPLHSWTTGDVLGAGDLNGNFTNLQGQITALQNPVALRYTLPNSLAIAQTADTDITGWEKVFDTNSSFNPTTGVFTAPVAGTYLITATINWFGVSTGTITHRFWVNGSSVAQNFLDDSTNAATPVNLFQHGAFTAQLSAGDTIYLQAFSDDPKSASVILDHERERGHREVRREGGEKSEAFLLSSFPPCVSRSLSDGRGSRSVI